MSLATIDRPTTSFSATSARSLVATNRQPQAASPETDTQTDAAQPRLRAVPAGTEARGFVLYVGLDELKAELAGTDLGQIVAQLKSLVAELVPTAETHAAVALAPQGAGGRDVDVVRLALQDPAALAKHRHAPEDEDRARDGVVIDLSRKRVLLDNDAANLTYKEFELLQYLVLREGRTIDRTEIGRASCRERVCDSV